MRPTAALSPAAASRSTASFKTQASQDIRRRLASCFVALEAETDLVAGYYTMSAAGIAISDLPPAVTKRHLCKDDA